MRARVADATGRMLRSCSESTTSRRTVPARKLRRSRLAAQANAPDATESNSLLLRRLEAGEFLHQHVAVGTLAPFEGSDAGAERRGHRVKLLAVGHVDDIRWSVREIFGLVGLEHLIERRIEKQISEAGLRLPCTFVRVLRLATHHYPDRIAAGLGRSEEHTS